MSHARRTVVLCCATALLHAAADNAPQGKAHEERTPVVSASIVLTLLELVLIVAAGIFLGLVIYRRRRQQAQASMSKAFTRCAGNALARCVLSMRDRWRRCTHDGVLLDHGHVWKWFGGE